MRFFIAIDLPEKMKLHIQKEAMQFLQNGVVLPKEDSYHVTLLFLGEISSAQIVRAKEILDSMKFEEFELELLGFGYFTKEFLKVIFAKVTTGGEELTKINALLTEKFVNADFAIKQEPFHAHVTVARVKSDRHKQELISKIESNKSAFGRFKVSSIKLMASELRSQGAIYSELHEVKF